MLHSKIADEAISIANAGPSKRLELTVAGKSIEPGQYIPRADGQKLPALAFAAPSGEYIGICLDLDAPFQSLTFLGPILHWIQPGIKPSGSGDGNKALSSGNVPFIADYIGPAPPPGSGPHRYLFFLCEQPADLDIKKYAPPAGQKYATTKRMRFGMDEFAREAKLGPIIAANYFTSN